MYLGVTGQYGSSSAHAHLGLLGWLSSAGFALTYAAADPNGELHRRARLHWLAHNLGLAVQASAMWLVIKTGNGIFGMLIGLGGLIITVATLWFAAMIWRRLRGSQPGT
jgi:hypothetical protein